MITTAKGRKLRLRLFAVERAIGNMITAAALLVAMALNKAVDTKTKVRANQGLPCAKDISHCDIADAAPEFCNAEAIPNDAAITISTCQSTARRAIRPVVQRVRIISPAANIAAFNMLSHPSATATTIRNKIVNASGARLWRIGCTSGNPLTR